MSRLLKYPIQVPEKIEVSQQKGKVTIKGPLGEQSKKLSDRVKLTINDNELYLQKAVDRSEDGAIAGTERAHINNMLQGVSQGFQKTLQLVGVGYRAIIKGNNLEVSVGYSQPVNYPIPDDVKVEAPSQTEIVVKGIDKQRVGQIAAELRSIRPPEPYKGKGIRYSNERVVQKEGKKK